MSVIKIFKIEDWYRCFGNDAQIISYLIGYKLFKDRKMAEPSVGFKEPHKIIKKLNQYEIDFNFIGMNKQKSFKNNHYDEQLQKAMKAKENNFKKEEKKHFPTEKKIDKERHNIKQVAVNTSVTIQNLTTNEIEIFHFIKTYKTYIPIYDPHGYKKKIIYKEVSIEENREKNEFSTDAEYFKLIKGKRVGDIFQEKNGQEVKIIKITNYQKDNIEMKENTKKSFKEEFYEGKEVLCPNCKQALRGVARGFGAESYFIDRNLEFYVAGCESLGDEVDAAFGCPKCGIAYNKYLEETGESLEKGENWIKAFQDPNCEEWT